jgi:RimJ/RimL family protein N-acetyltransferase
METNMKPVSKAKLKPVPFLSFPGGALCVRPEVDEETFMNSLIAINDPLSRMYLSADGKPQSAAEQREWWTKPITGNNMQFFLWYDNRYIGGMGVFDVSERHGTATTGSFIWFPEYRGRGIATNAKLVLLEYLFNTCNLRQIKSEAIGYNNRSTSYSKKCGYVEVARVPKEFRFGEDYADRVILVAERQTWLPYFLQFQADYQDHPEAYLTRQQLLEKDQKKR